MLAAFIAFLSGVCGCALYAYAFRPWIIPLYAAASLIMIAAAYALGFIIAKKGDKKKAAIKALIPALIFSALYFGVVFIVNNVLYNGTKPEIATKYAVVMISVFFTELLVLAAKKCGKKVFPAVLSVILALAVGYSPVWVADYIQNKLYSEGSAAPMNLSSYTEKERKPVTDADFYVSPAGSDENDGSFKKPFATIEKARDAAAMLDRSSKDKITVAVMAGDYRVKSLVFTEKDGGTKDCPVYYCAYGDGEVVLNGGITIDSDDFSSVTDEEMLSRLPASAKEKVMCADLKKYGLTADDWGKIYAIGSYNTAAKYDGDYVGGIYCELFVNDKRQNLARYPDEGYLYTGKVLKTGEGRESDGSQTRLENWDELRNHPSDIYSVDKKLADRISSWKTLDDVWMFGFWKYDWADASTLIGDFNAEERTLSPKFVSTYGTKEGAPYYFFNVFEELDAPGEWYLDRENGIVYLYPEKDISECAVDMSVTSENILRVDGACHITFDGFTFKGTRGDAVNITGDYVTLEKCLIKNVAGSAVYADGYNNLIYANEITHTGKGGITISGGDRETLTPGNSKADNNYIHDWSEIYQTYQPAVSLGGVGNICSHNEMRGSPHEAVTFGGNDHIIEYNNIHEVCLLGDDAGAIYAGRRWDFYGTVIRYNAVYDLGTDGHKPCGIYLDDALSGITVYGNLIVNAPSIGLHLGGGRDLTVKNNIVLNTIDNSISYDDRAREGVFGGWFNHSSQEDGDMWTNLFASPWKSEIWQKAYPQMTKFSDDFNDTDNPDFVPNPANSDVSLNVIVSHKGEIGNISQAASQFSSVENNSVYKNSEADKVFADYQGGDYTLVNAPEGFEQLPFGEIGRY